MTAAYPCAISGTWTDVERTARHVHETIDRDTTDWELAEAVLVLLGAAQRQREALTALGVNGDDDIDRLVAGLRPGTAGWLKAVLDAEK